MSVELVLHHHYHFQSIPLPLSSSSRISPNSRISEVMLDIISTGRGFRSRRRTISLRTRGRKTTVVTASPQSLTISAAQPPLDLTEDNVRQVLADARVQFEQIFDTSVGITGEAELAEVDGPYVTIRLRGRFWHERSLVLARLGNYLKQRIPEIMEVDIEDEKQLDDSPENF